AEQLRADVEEGEEAPIFVADSGLYSVENVARLSAAGVRWISRVPETSKEAHAALQVAEDSWQQEGGLGWAPVSQAPTGERWVVVRTVHPPSTARSGHEQHSPVRCRRRVRSGSRRCGIWAISASPANQTPRRRSTSGSSSAPTGSTCRRASSPSPS